MTTDKRELLLFRNKEGQIERAELEESDVPLLAKAFAMSRSETKPKEELLKMAQVEKRVGLGKSTIYDLMAVGKFPKSVSPPGVKAARWRSSEVDEWIANVSKAQKVE